MLVRLRARARAFWNRPAAFGSVLLSYLGIFLVAATLGGAAIYNDATSTSQLCQVVEDVHDQAVADYDREYADLLNIDRSYMNTLDYLENTPRSESPSLYDRVKQNLPQTRERVVSQQKRVAAQRDRIAATAPPRACTRPSERFNF